MEELFRSLVDNKGIMKLKFQVLRITNLRRKKYIVNKKNAINILLLKFAKQMEIGSST